MSAEFVYRFEFEDKTGPAASTGSSLPSPPAHPDGTPSGGGIPAGHRGRAYDEIPADVRPLPTTRPPGAPSTIPTGVPVPPPAAPASAGAAIRASVSQSVLSSATSAISSAAGGVAGGTAGGIAGAAAGPALAALGPVGLAIGAVVLAGAALVKGFDLVNTKLAEMARELTPFSAALTVAQARNEVAKTMLDIGRANQYGDMLARNVDATAKLDRTVTQLGDKISSVFGPLIADLKSGLANTIGLLTGIQDTMDEKMSTMIDLAVPQLQAAEDALEEQRRNMQIPGIDNLMEQFIAMPTIENQVLGDQGSGVDPQQLAELRRSNDIPIRGVTVPP